MDHLLSMETNLIEKQPCENFGARVEILKVLERLLTHFTWF